MNILTIGYNSRPIVTGLKLLGHRIIAIDYWGDKDIYPYCDKLITPISNNAINKRMGWNTKNIINKIKNTAEVETIDYAIIGSGFDDNFDLWKKIEKKFSLLNISLKTLINVRDRENLMNELQKNGLPYIPIKKVKSLYEAEKFAEQIGYPIIIRPLKSSGAYKLKLIENSSLLKKKYFTGGYRYIEKFFVTKLSLSQIINTTNNDSKVIISSIQIMEEPNFNNNFKFFYRGNICPYENNKIIKKMGNISKKIASLFAFKGLIGMDYILTEKNEVYLTEVNPRIPGSIDPAQISTQKNLFLHHLESFKTNKLLTAPVSKGYSTKLIVKTKIPYLVPRFPVNIPISDIPPQGAMIPGGSPLCTIHTFDQNSSLRSYNNAQSLAKYIQLLNKTNNSLT